MRAELDRALCAEFPSIFRDRGATMQESCMHWGMDCGDGWHSLIRAVCLYVDNVLVNARSGAIHEYRRKHGIDFDAALPPEVLKAIGVDDMAVVAEQVKEKYGTLCFYWRGEGLTDAVHGQVTGAVDMAELLSGRTCEKCGAPGELYGPGWLATRCGGCAGGMSTMVEYNAWEDGRQKAGIAATGEGWALYKTSKESEDAH